MLINLDLVSQADEDRSGNLSRDEFYTALKHSGLGLTRKEMNVLMTMVWPMNLHVSHSHRISMRLQVDEDADGSISYAEFVPVGINTLIEVISQEIAYSQVSMEEADIRGHLQTVFMTMDTKGTGKLSRDEIADCLAKVRVIPVLLDCNGLKLAFLSIAAGGPRPSPSPAVCHPLRGRRR